jgi:hypothetical protein
MPEAGVLTLSSWLIQATEVPYLFRTFYFSGNSVPVPTNKISCDVSWLDGWMVSDLSPLPYNNDP